MTTFKTITDRVDDATRIAREHGWGWTEEQRMSRNVYRLLSDLALVHSEVSEAVEAVRDGEIEMTGGQLIDDKITKPEGLVVELADVVIRIMHLCGELDLNLERAVVAKMLYNEQRPFKHGGRKA